MALRLPRTKRMLRREAANWLARLHRGPDPRIERDFQSWYAADARHAAAFDGVRQTYEQAGLLRHSRTIAAIPDESAVRMRRRSLRPAFAVAAAAIALAALGILVIRGSGLLFGTDAMMLTTKVGEIRQVDLPDGSKVTLDTATNVEIEVGPWHRRAQLKYGRARFQVAQGGAPFVVESRAIRISTRKGVVDVEQGARQDEVQLLAGAADVRDSRQPRASALALAPGDAVTIDPHGAERKHIMPSQPDWPSGMLQFDETPLGEAVALANRYSQEHILLVGRLDTLRVTGAFCAGDTPGLAKALAAAFQLSLRRAPDGSWVLSRSPSLAVQKKRGG